jgi:hypothetical protein
MVAAAQRDDEFVAHLAAERRMLREPKMMGIGGASSANQAGLLGHESAHPRLREVDRATPLTSLGRAQVSTASSPDF